jgi:hypothetical protein
MPFDEEMQQTFFEARTTQYLLMLSPHLRKSRALMFIGLDKFNQPAYKKK